MTSQRFSANKKAAEYDFKVALKNIIIPAVLTLLSFMVMFVAAPLNRFFVYFDGRLNMEQLRRDLILVLSDMYHGEYAGLYFLFLGAFFAVMSFSFISRKKAVNVFFSTSVDRRTLYKNRVLACTLMTAAATAVPIIIDIIINMYFLENDWYVIKCGVALFAECFIYIFTGFAIMAVAMTLCNTVIEAVFFGAAAVGAPSIIVYFVNALCSAFLKGYNFDNLFMQDDSRFVQPSLFHYTSILNPFLLGKAYGADHSIGENIINFVYRVNEENSTLNSWGAEFYGYEELTFDYILPIIVWTAINICFIFTARQLFIKIKAENAGVYGSSGFASGFFAVMCMLALFAFWLDAVSYTYSDLSPLANTVVTVASGSLIMIVAYLVIISICKKTIRRRAKDFVIPAAAVLCVTAITCILSSGGFGYSEYVPEPEKIEKAIITNNITDAASSEILSAPEKNSYCDDIFSEYYSDRNAIGVFDDAQDLKLLTDISRELVKESDNMNGSSVCIYYKLKNGRIISRYYKSTDYDASYKILSLRDSKAAREELTYLMTGKINDAPIVKRCDNLSIDSSSMFNYSYERDAAYVMQGGRIYAVSNNGMMNGNLINNTPELRQALLTDLLSQTYEQRFKPSEPAIGGLFFSSSDYINNVYYDSVYDALIQELGEDVYNSAYEGGYYIYPSMTNTVNYLKSTGEYDLLAHQEDEILSISIERCRAVRDKQFEWWGDNSSISYQFKTLNQLYTDIDDLTEEEIDYDIYSDSYNAYYNRQMTVYFENGSVVEDNDKIAELMSKSRNYYFADNDDYIIMVNYKNAGYVSYLIPSDELPDWALK